MAVRERKFFVGGNWKMNGTTESINGIMAFLKEGPLSQDSGIADPRFTPIYYELISNVHSCSYTL